MIAIDNQTKMEITTLLATARRVSIVGVGSATTSTALQRARKELRELEQTIRNIRKGLPK